MRGIFGFGKKKEEQVAQTASASSGKFLVIYDKRKCIGSGTCAAVCEDHWIMEKDGKAMLKGSVLNGNGLYEKHIDDAHLAGNKMAAEGCPPNCIHIVNKETGEKIV